MAGEAQEQTQTTDPYVEFSNVFDSLFDKEEGAPTDEETPESTPAAGEQNPADDAQQPAQPADGAGDSGQPAQPAGDAAPAAGEGEPAPAGDQSAGGDEGGQGQPVVDWQAEFQKLRGEFDAFRQAPAQPAAPAAPSGQADTPPEPQPTPIYSQAEQDELTQLKKDWPDSVRLFELMARQLQVDTLSYAFREVSQVLTPLQQAVQATTLSEHNGAIYDAHPDYDALYQPCVDWIEKQPSFLKAACQQVMKEGTAEDVIAMVQRFKDETGWQAAAPSGGSGAKPQTPAAAASAAPAQPKTGLSETAKKAAQSMGVVGTKRSAGTTTQSDPNDFDGAWEEANASR